jgi:tRNA-binding protein
VPGSAGGKTGTGRRAGETSRSVTANWQEFERLELAVGRVVEVEEFREARNPAWKLTLDFGPRGVRRSSAQVTHYARDELLGRQVVAVLGFEPKRIAGFESEALVLGGISDAHGVVLLRPDREIEDGSAVA